MWRKILSLPARVKRLEKQMSAQADEIAQIKADVVNYQAGVNAKIAALEATIAANGGGNADVQAALDDLKTTAEALTVPA